MAAISVALLYKTTKNYVQQRREIQGETEEGGDSNDDWEAEVAR